MQKGWVLVLLDIFSIQKSIQAISELLLPTTVANTHVIKSSERLPQPLRPTRHCIYHSHSLPPLERKCEYDTPAKIEATISRKGPED